VIEGEAMNGRGRGRGRGKGLKKNAMRMEVADNGANLIHQDALPLATAAAAVQLVAPASLLVCRMHIGIQ
jgi:hypothetical protein